MQLLLVIIYIAFISLGLPDSLLGSAWPSIRGELGVPMSYAGVLSMIMSGGTILSCLFSGVLMEKMGPGRVTAVSVAITAAALWGFSVSDSFWMLCLIALPYGLGAGAVDAALNHYVALHYKARHMNWLHCFWGIGASAGPCIMGWCLAGGSSWTGGYRVISLMQIGLTAVLFSTLSLWKGQKAGDGGEEGEGREPAGRKRFLELLGFPGVREAVLSFFCYCAAESTAGLWAASYMVMNRGLTAEAAARWASLFYVGITAGRFVCGFITMKFSDRVMVRMGQALAVGGILMLMLPLGQGAAGAGLVLVGVGCAPIYPALIHETPENFNADLSQTVMGMQVAFAYIGVMVMPTLFGILSGTVGIGLYPYYLLLIAAAMVFTVERLNRLSALRMNQN